MEQVELKAQVRQSIGTRRIKPLRNQGWVPGVVYHKNEDTVAISVLKADLSKILRTGAGENILINLKIENEKRKKPRTVLIKEIQHHPFRNEIVHVDLNEISLTELVKINIPVVAKGDPVGVKQQGGVLDHPTREVEIECLPANIPQSVEVDVEQLKLGDSIHVSDLKVAEGVKILTDGGLVVFTVKQPKVEKEEPVAEAAEPEVITEKKPEEGAQGEEAPALQAKKPEAAAPPKKEEK